MKPISLLFTSVLLAYVKMQVYPQTPVATLKSRPNTESYQAKPIDIAVDLSSRQNRKSTILKSNPLNRQPSLANGKNFSPQLNTNGNFTYTNKDNKRNLLGMGSVAGIAGAAGAVAGGLAAAGKSYFQKRHYKKMNSKLEVEATELDFHIMLDESSNKLIVDKIHELLAVCTNSLNTNKANVFRNINNFKQESDRIADQIRRSLENESRD